MAAVPRVLHRLVIARAGADAVSVIEGGGVVRLPSFVHDDKHTADADYINAAVRAR